MAEQALVRPLALRLVSVVAGPDRYSGGGAPPIVDPWILATGFWNDAGIWDDAETWVD
jgi:hypothetical protein